MQDRVFKIAMAYLEDTFNKVAVTSKEIKDIAYLVGLVKGEIKDAPKIEDTNDLYESAEGLGIKKLELPKIISGIMQDADILNLPSGLLGDIGEHLGDKKGIGFIPSSVLERTFLRDGLSKYVGSNKWKYFFKSDNKLKNFEKEKGI